MARQPQLSPASSPKNPRREKVVEASYRVVAAVVLVCILPLLYSEVKSTKTPPSAEVPRQYVPVVQPNQASRPVRTDECPGKAETLHLTPGVWDTSYNPGEKCQALLDIAHGGPFRLRNKDGKEFPYTGGYTKRNAEAIMPVGGDAEIKRSLCPLYVEPPRGMSLAWDCTPKN